MRLSSDPAARRRLLALCCAAALALLAGVIVGSTSGGDEGAQEVRPGAGRPASDAARPRPPSGAARLPLRQQVGQLLVMSFDGTAAPEFIHRRLRGGEGAGVILFGKNMPDARSAAALTGSLQRSARGGALIAADQEGGAIRSLAFAPPQASQGTLASPAAARDSAAAGARALRAAGLNVNLAPVADVAAAGSVLAGRAFPGDAAAVGRLVEASVRAHARERVATTVKHFPGLGRARQNTDDAPVAIDASRAELAAADLPPFRAAARAGAPLVMTSHALYPAYDRGRIASQSPVLTGEVLRGELGFRGAVITDSIEADAVLSRSNVAVAAARAIESGADLVLTTGSASWDEIHPHLIERARSSRRFRARVREACGRVLALKRALGLRPPS